jgi:broad specificity phosphatase PhoE
VEDLRDGGHVLVFRHARTDTRTELQESLDSCARQRNLTRAGRAQARRIGADLRALGIPIGEVLASPMCRTRETAELAFGEAELSRDLLSLGVDGTAADDEERITALEEAVAARPAEGNTVLVTHTGNIGNALGESVDEGEALVYTRGRLVRTVRPEEWSALAARG